MKFVKLLFSLFTLAGIGALVLSAMSLQRALDFVVTAQPAEGTVVRLERVQRSNSDSRTGYTYAPVIRFRTADGREISFRSSSSSKPPSYSRGERVRVLYDPETPKRAEIDGFLSIWGNALFNAVLGLVFTTVGIGFWTRYVGSRRLEAWLSRYGQRVNARVIDVPLNRATRRDDPSFWHIVAQWMDPLTQEVHLFESFPVTFDPAPFIKGETVSVLVDPKNPKRYFFDLSFLFKPTGQS